MSRLVLVLTLAVLLTGCAPQYAAHPTPITALDSAKVYADSVAAKQNYDTRMRVLGMGILLMSPAILVALGFKK